MNNWQFWLLSHIGAKEISPKIVLSKGTWLLLVLTSSLILMMSSLCCHELVSFVLTVPLKTHVLHPIKKYYDKYIPESSDSLICLRLLGFVVCDGGCYFIDFKIIFVNYAFFECTVSFKLNDRINIRLQLI